MTRPLSPRRNVVARLLAAATLWLVAAPAVLDAAYPPEATAADYEKLRQGRYSSQALAIPEGGVSFRREEASWTLEQGQVRFLEPAADGTVTGFVFEGRGRFTMSVPDRVELDQLRRVAERPDLAGVDEPFTALLVRTSESLVHEVFGAGLPSGGHTAHPMAAKRHENWLERRSVDADARVLCGLMMPGDRYLRADVETASFDWLTYEYDALQREEIVLAKYQPQTDFVEEWVRLDRPEDRDPRGRPSVSQPHLIDVRHVDVKIDLTEAGRLPRAGLSEIYPRHVRFAVEIELVPEVDGPLALPLTLHPFSEVTAVRTAEGQELTFLRSLSIGRVAPGIRAFDDSLVVVLDRPLARGETRRLVVEYEQELLNYVSGRWWYPGEDTDALGDPHTARLRIVARTGDDVRAMGKLVEEGREGKDMVRVWSIEKPAKMVTFSFAERFEEQSIEHENLPEVIAFAARAGVKNKTFNVAADVVNSLIYFEQLFASDLPVEQLYVTSIVGSHGQAFDGFIHLSESSFNSEHPGPTQLFRAHEVAHQWWGHEVGWASYRDQWLSEAFAEYSAMMFIEATLDKGGDTFREIVAGYFGQAIGEPGVSRYTRAFEHNDKQRQRIGPISIGYRASTGTSLGGYAAQTYYKGAMVLHMLRTLLRNVTKSEDLFVTVLRDFAATYRGRAASTDDFIGVLDRHTANLGLGGWSWFFDQWVHSTDIPTYTWSYEVGEREGKTVLTVDVEQTGVPAGFRMPVPVRIELGKDREGQIMVMVDEPRKSLSVPLPSKPTSVDFNPDGAVLARVKKR